MRQDGVCGGKGTDGEVANALVCKTSIHGFKSHSVLQQNKGVAAASKIQTRTLRIDTFVSCAGNHMLGGDCGTTSDGE